jgi:hypothetical protein
LEQYSTGIVGGLRRKLYRTAMCHLTLQNIFERSKFVEGSIFAVRSKIFFSLLW